MEGRQMGRRKMSRLGKWLWFSGTALLVIVMLFGCAQLFWNGPQQDGWYIQLNIGDPGAKAIDVDEYDVTEVDVAIYAPGEELPLWGVTWYAQDPPLSERIPVSQEGQYRIEVTHVSDNNGEPVEAEESATFNIKAMIITVIDIIPGCIGTIEIEPGTEGGPSAEEVNECALTVMTALWEAMAPLYEGSDEFPPGIAFDFSNFKDPGDGEPPFGGILIVTFTDFSPSGSDVTINGDVAIDITFPQDLLGTLEEAISASLSVSCLAGETVDIDLTLLMFMEDAPYWNTLEWDGSIAVNGQEANVDQVMSDWKAMVIDETTSTDGTITVRVTGADAHNGSGFYYAVGAEGDDLSVPANWLGIAPTNPTIADGTVECITVVVGTNDPKTFTGGESYDVSGIIDVDDSGDLSLGDYIFGPDTVIVDGETTLELVYPTDFTLEEQPWIIGFWVSTRTYAQFSNVVEFNADGTYSFYDNYDLSGGPVESGPWSLEGDVLTVGGTPYAITWISDDEWSSEDIGETFYRKGTEPGGYLYDQTETELSAGVWKEGTLPVHDLKLYSFMASSAGDYEVRWEQGDTPPYTAHVDFYVYRSDQATLIFVCREEAPKPSPQTVTLGASEKIFLIVYTRYEGGTFRIKVE
jgi:hypothetical protein